MESSMPTDLTDWVAIIVAGLFGLFFVWEYRRLAKRRPGRRGGMRDIDSDDGGDEGDGADGGGDGGDGGGGD
jgi:hypothetical protein